MTVFQCKQKRRLRRLFLLLLSAALLAGCGPYTACAEQAAPEPLQEKPLRAGDTELRFRWPGDPPDTLQANVFSGGEALMDQAFLEDGLLVLHLLRPVRAGETLRVVLAEGGRTLQDLSLTAQEALNGSLAAMEARLVRMAAVWEEDYLPSLLGGAFYIPPFWTDLPFTLYPDEAPAITVTEEADAVRIRLEGALPDGWQFFLGTGYPVDMAPCTFRPEDGCWTGSGSFDGVYLVREGVPDGFRLSVAYSRQTGFAAEYPVLEYADESGPETVAFACYGWGTIRNFLGSMYVLVRGEQSYYAEYGLNHYLTGYTDGVTGCLYGICEELLEGEEPEGFVNPVVHLLVREEDSAGTSETAMP